MVEPRDQDAVHKDALPFRDLVSHIHSRRIGGCRRETRLEASVGKAAMQIFRKDGVAVAGHVGIGEWLALGNTGQGAQLLLRNALVAYERQLRDQRLGSL